MNGHAKLVLAVAMNDVLTEKQQNVIRSRYGLDDGLVKSGREVARQFGISEMAVRDHEKKSFSRLLRSEYCQVLAEVLDGYYER